MDKPIRCTSCGTTLEQHCGSPSCRWLACLTQTCVARFYDLERGIRSLRSGGIEQLGAPPTAPTPEV